MQACLTVGLLLLATLGGQGPSHVMRLAASPLAVNVSTLCQSAHANPPQRELRAGLGTLHSLLPHPLLLLGVAALHTATSEAPQPPGMALATRADQTTASGAPACRLGPVRAP